MKKGKQIPELERQPSTTSAKLKRKGRKREGLEKNKLKLLEKADQGCADWSREAQKRSEPSEQTG